MGGNVLDSQGQPLFAKDDVVDAKSRMWISDLLINFSALLRVLLSNHIVTEDEFKTAERDIRDSMINAYGQTQQGGANVTGSEPEKKSTTKK